MVLLVNAVLGIEEILKKMRKRRGNDWALPIIYRENRCAFPG